MKIKTVIASGDTYDAISVINQGVTDFKAGSKTTFSSNDISFVSNTGFNNNFHLQVAPIDKSSVAMNGHEYIAAYDISLYNYTTIVPVSGGQYQISMPVSKVYDTYKVAYLNAADQITEEFDATAQNGVITFTTSHLSNYAIYGRSKSGGNSVANPKTADPVMIYGGIFGISLIVLIGGIIGYRKLSKRN